ncbi:MAG: SH3 domain-containing protein [Pseudomonadota bacterium]
MLARIVFAAALAISATALNPQSAYADLCVVNVASWDVLNVRERPSASSPIVNTLKQGQHGPIWSNGTCIPQNRDPGSRWCPIMIGAGSGVGTGWVKARYIAEC